MDIRSQNCPSTGMQMNIINDYLMPFRSVSVTSDTTSLNSSGIFSASLSGSFKITCTTPRDFDCARSGKEDVSFDTEWTRILCSNRSCDQSGLMHTLCAKKWESILMCSIANIESSASTIDNSQWSEYLWSKNNCANVIKKCMCRCGKGTLRLCWDVLKLERSSLADSDLISWQSRRSSSNKDNESQEDDCLTALLYSQGFGLNRPSLLSASANSNSPSMKALASRKKAGSLGNFFIQNGSMPINASIEDVMKLSRAQQYAVLTKGMQSASIDVDSRKQSIKPRVRVKSASIPGFHTHNNARLDKPLLLSTQSAPGNTFEKRKDFTVFKSAPYFKQNSYYIQMEDDSCTGNDDTKVFLLNHLTRQRITNIPCILCGYLLNIYDHMPLIDGTFFISPLSYNHQTSIPIPWGDLPPGALPYNPTNHPSTKYLHAVCMACMHGEGIACKICRNSWTGKQLLIGSMYTHDIFAASLCCQSRMSCKNCGLMPFAAATTPKHFSHLSRMFDCMHCNCRDFHFVKPLDEIFERVCSNNSEKCP